MDILNLHEITQVAGSVCGLHYEVEANAYYLPFISQYFLSLQTNQINATQFLQALNNAGLSPANIVFNVIAVC